MRTITPLDDIYSGEHDWVEFDFSLWADDSLPVQSMTVTCTVLGGQDSTPQNLLVGLPVQTSSSSVAQHIQSNKEGVTYMLKAIAIVNGEPYAAVGYIRSIGPR